MHIDYKITTWKRIHIPEELEEKVKKRLEGCNPEQITSLDDLEDILGSVSSEIIEDTEEYLYPNENSQNPTLELFEDNGSDPIFTNGLD